MLQIYKIYDKPLYCIMIARCKLYIAKKKKNASNTFLKTHEIFYDC